MGLRCSLLGHTYGDSEIERDREERGDEVVVTIREIKTCQRCGVESVVSENKEVTSVATPDEVEGEPDDEDEAAVDDAFDEIEEAEEEGPEHDPETDDAVILDDDEDEADPGDREYGEWPDAGADHADAEADPAAAAEDADHEWPAHDDDDDAGYDATTPDDEPDPDVEFAGTTPEPQEADAAVGDAVEPEVDAFDDDADATEDADAGFTRADDAPAPDVDPRPEEAKLVCPECGYTDPQDSGSLRQGDICPECRSGYLAARDAAGRERNR